MAHSPTPLPLRFVFIRSPMRLPVKQPSRFLYHSRVLCASIVEQCLFSSFLIDSLFDTGCFSGYIFEFAAFRASVWLHNLIYRRISIFEGLMNTGKKGNLIASYLGDSLLAAQFYNLLLGDVVLVLEEFNPFCFCFLSLSSFDRSPVIKFCADR